MLARSSFQTATHGSPSYAAASTPILAERPICQIDAAVMDYFLIEMVSTLRTSSAVATARSKQLEQEMIAAGLLPPPAPSLLKQENPRDSTTSLTSKSKGTSTDEEEEALRSRLEAIGIHVGANYTERLCRDRPLFAETLDAIKFVCKDIWAACWEKQVDNLRTNHRGVYVLQDNTFKPIVRLSSPDGRTDAIRRAKTYVAMPTGIIKGALLRLGIQASITPEITSLPQCTFQVKLSKGS